MNNWRLRLNTTNAEFSATPFKSRSDHKQLPTLQGATLTSIRLGKELFANYVMKYRLELSRNKSLYKQDDMKHSRVRLYGSCSRPKDLLPASNRNWKQQNS